MRLQSESVAMTAEEKVVAVPSLVGRATEGEDVSCILDEVLWVWVRWLDRTLERHARAGAPPPPTT